MMRVILLDDERTILDELEYLLKQQDQIEIAASYTNPMRALEEFNTVKPDAAFLDIDMPPYNGMSIAKKLLELNSNLGIIFVTAFNEYAVKAFEVNAIDYILKPVSDTRLIQAVEKLKKAARTIQPTKHAIADKLGRIERLIRQDSERIAVYGEEDIVLLKMSEVYYIEAELRKTYISAASGRYVTKEILDSLEEKLVHFGFFRCHRSYLINLRYVCKISPMFNNNFILNQEGHSFEIPVSRNHIKELKTLLGI